MKSISALLPAILAILFSTSSCKKDKSSTPPTPMGTLYLHINSNIDTARVESGDESKDADGRLIRLNVAQFYMSDVTLHKADGSYVILHKAYVLKKLAGTTYYVDSVDAGNYVSISFSIGIDAATNTTNPSSYPATSPLAIQSPNMWFGTPAQGYIFLNVRGMADTTATHTGPANFPFEYLVGTSAMLKSVQMPNKPITVSANQATTIHLKADYGKVLHGIDFRIAAEASPWLNATQATQVANNIPNMFAYE